MKTPALFSDQVINFFTNIRPPEKLPDSIQIMNPYNTTATLSCISDFYKKYYNDKNKRIFILGINPGRYGGGITGISFTDPVALENYCGIKNDFNKVTELSSRFIYKMINEFGGTEKFYSKFFISAIYPFALVKAGKNYNYYDDPKTAAFLQNDILSLLEKQINFGAKKSVAICLGKKNEKYLRKFNDKLNYFNEILTLDHPRYIMQYKSKLLENYIEQYLSVLNEALRISGNNK